VSASLTALLCIGAGVLFIILAVRGLSHPRTRSRGNQFGVAGTVIVAIATTFVPAPAEARSLTQAEQASLTEVVHAFDAAMRSANYVGIMQVVPSRVLEHIAGKAGVDVEHLTKAIAQQMAEVFAQVKIDSFGIDLAAAEHRELTNRTPYVLIPTEVVMTAGGQKTAFRSHTLAILDDGAWYLLRVSDAAQLEIMRQVYPEFVDIEFPRGSMEALSE
jgi:hypothetical protein